MTCLLRKEVASELMVYSYRHGFSGFAAKLTESQAQKLSELPGVVRVIPNSLHRLQTTRSWDFLGLSSHYPTNILQNSKMGDGVIIGVFDTGKVNGFTGLTYPEGTGLDPNSASACQDLSLNSTLVAGKVLLCFASVTRRVAIRSAAETVKEAGGVGLIIAKNPTDALVECTDGFPCIEVDYEIGTRILYYIRSTNSPTVKSSPSKTLLARTKDASGFPLFAEGSPQKPANPFDFGGGIVNPNGAADPGLVYDMDTSDYIHYLCAMGYNNSAITRLMGQAIVCPVEKPSILDVNVPSITISSLRNSVTLTRTVTNVGAPNSIYRAVIEPPTGVIVTVRPDILVFNSTIKKISFHVTVSAAHQVHIVYMGERQHDDPNLITKAHHDLLASIIGSKEGAIDSMVYSYRHGFSGFAAKLTEFQARQISELPGVVHVIPNRFHSLQTTRTWDYLDLSSHYPPNLLNDTNMGDGIIIGLLDTDCNRKLIGAKYFIDGFLAENEYQPFNTSSIPDYISPRDGYNHGTPTSTVAAGSFVANASYKGLAMGTVRGGAPRARIAMYKVCWNTSQGLYCSSADILKAFDEAIHDGVDLLSVSLGPPQFPLFAEVDERDGIAIGSFHAVAKGIPVICAAGNGGPDAKTVINTAPWILAVAATTLDRSFPTPIILGNNITILGQGLYTGKEIGYIDLVFPEIVAGACDSLSFNHTSVNGKVVLCFTSLADTVGVAAVISAESAVRAAGGVGLIVAKNPSDFMVPCGDDFPCLMVDYELGTQILLYIRSVSLDSQVAPTWKTDPFGQPIFAEGSPRKLANPFDFGGGLVNPNRAAKPGLIYDMDTDDYVHYLCALPVGYNESAISQLVGRAISCPSPTPSVLDVNVPSITIPNLRDSVTLTRRVTNVGPPNSIYKQMVEPPFGIAITVTPDTLVFNSTAQEISFQVRLTTSHQVNSGYRTAVFLLVNLLLILNGENRYVTPVRAESRVHIVYMGERQHDNPNLITKAHHDLLASIIGSKEGAMDSMVYSYRHGFSGFAAKLSEFQARQISELPGVVHVIPNRFHSLQTTRTWDYLDLSSQFSSYLLNDTNMGDGIIIGLLDTGKEIGYTDLVYPERPGLRPHLAGVCESLSFNYTSVNGKVVLCFTTVARRSAVTSAASAVRAAGGVGLIVAKNPSDVMGPCGDDFPCLVVDYELGTQILLYIRSASKEAAKNSMLYSYKHGFSGFAARLTESQAEEIAAFPGVVQVIPNRIHKLHTTRSWEFMGLNYHSSKNLLTESNMGEGTIIGVIDSGNKGQSIDTRLHSHGFTGITYSDRIAANSSDNSAEACLPGSLNATLAAGKIILCFGQSETQDIFSAAISVVEAGGIGVIFAQRNSDGLDYCHFIPCIKVDYEVGTQILSYIRRARSPIAKLTSQTGTDGSDIAEEGSTRKPANPFDIGSGLVNPNRAIDPGLVYNAGIDDYILFLCGCGYSSRSVTDLTKAQINCTKTRLDVLNLNLPSITIPNLTKKVTVTRIVTNVGAIDSVYKAQVQAPQGIKMKVEPQILRFNKTTQILPFKVTFISTLKVHGGDYRFGSLIWTDGKHIVRSPISVRAIWFGSYTN
ncbi:hypothetical protein CCACVL1_13316 [Corchorus capsularis]|uniref:Peptidase S8/S53 domain-containing protein n=1 Tax=Corchorus capsularis TaxID=210143 RepID=A0A1R3IBG6_COCAP|nr:hypothetical protein CCACVL1_13316 [Corchorus capsularis]